MKCERCREGQATFHWTEALGGLVLERHLCEDCRSEEFPGTAAAQNELCFQCWSCGHTVEWQFPYGGCGHPPDAYERKTKAELEIATCGCGMRFVAALPTWRCTICGAESVIQPRERGQRGYLQEHLYGPPEATEISIRGILP